MKDTKVAEWLDGWQTAPEGPMHARLHRTLADLIRRGAIAPGEVLPAERVLAAQLRVSRTVVARAYQSLVTDGRAVSRRGSGTCVAGAPAAPRRANTGLNYLLTSQGGKIDLNQAGFTEGDPQMWELMSIAPTEAARLMRHATGYLPTGLPELRERLAAWYTHRGAPSRPEHFLITNGAQQALSLLARRFTTPARIVIENPTYAGASQLLRRLGHTLVPVACEPPDGMPVQALAAAAREPGVRAVLVTPTGQNPTGASWPKQARQRFLTKAASLEDCLVIEDDTLAPLWLGETADEPVPLAEGNLENLVTIGSVSKWVWPGLRVGWVRADPRVITALTTAKLFDDLGCSPLTQAVAARAVDRSDALLAERRATLRHRRDVVGDLLAAALPAWAWIPPTAGLYGWIRMPADTTPDFHHLLRHVGVLLGPGGALSLDGTHDTYCRVSLAADEHTLRAGLTAAADAWRTYTANGADVGPVV